MKVLVVCQYYYPEPFRISDICEALAARGHSVTVVTGTPNYPEGVIYKGYEKGAQAEEIRNGVAIHRCPLIPRKSGALYRFLNYYSFVFSSERYLRKTKEEFDVVFVNQLSPVMMAQSGLNWAKRHGKKCVLYCLDLWPESLLVGGIRAGSPIYRIFQIISDRIYRRADRILLSSGGFTEILAGIPGMKRSKLGYLPQYAEALFGELPPTPEKQMVDFVFAGNIGAIQSVETIVEAARLLQHRQDIRIHILGSGVSLDNCRKLAQGLGNIQFHGRKDLVEMPKYYAMADAMLISLGKDEVMSRNTPGKLQSYMAAGKAVIGSIDGETARIIQEADCGLCAPAEDALALAKILEKTADDPVRTAAWGRNARGFYEKYFSKQSFLDTLEGELERCC